MRRINPEDLVQYLYNEPSSQKARAVKIALERSWCLREELEQIAFAQKQLEELHFSPREEAVKKLIAYGGGAVASKSTPVKPSWAVLKN